MLNEIIAAVNIPVVASGGAGSIGHFVELFKKTGADAGLGASVFHFREIAIRDLKRELGNNDIGVRI